VFSGTGFDDLVHTDFARIVLFVSNRLQTAAGYIILTASKLAGFVAIRPFWRVRRVAMREEGSQLQRKYQVLVVVMVMCRC
jgi:hypothetical protein